MADGLGDWPENLSTIFPHGFPLQAAADVAEKVIYLFATLLHSLPSLCVRVGQSLSAVSSSFLHSCLDAEWKSGKNASDLLATDFSVTLSQLTAAEERLLYFLRNFHENKRFLSSCMTFTRLRPRKLNYIDVILAEKKCHRTSVDFIYIAVRNARLDCFVSIQ